MKYIYILYIYIYIYIYIRYQCFPRVNVTLCTVSSIHSRQLKNKIQLATQKLD